MYYTLFAAACCTLKDFGLNTKHLGAEIGMTAVLHTHSRRLDYHPHVHVIVPAGGMDRARRQWIKKKGKYLFNAFALAKVFRARFLAAITAAGLPIPAQLPAQWVTDCKPVGKGEPALEYLSRYLYRGVISENNIAANRDGKVTFRYIDSKTGKMQYRTLKGEDFLWLVLQHVHHGHDRCSNARSARPRCASPALSELPGNPGKGLTAEEPSTHPAEEERIFL